jgi:hypothetical protein
MDCSAFHDDMVEVLYGEAPPETSRRLEGHLSGCATCREEMAAFRGVREKLGAWTLPAARPAARRFALLPLEMLAAAALVLLAFGAGLGLSGSELSYAGGRFAFHLGHSESTVKKLLAEQKAEAPREEDAPAVAQASAADEAVLKRVEAMIRESDERQTQRLDTYSQRMESQRRLDLARMSAALSYLDGKTGQDVARTAELVQYVLQSSDKR